MTADYVFVRPNGKPYRPRTTELRARGWGNEDLDPCGVLVLGTLNADEARDFGTKAANYWYGAGVLTDPRSGWYRDGYDWRGRAWIEDPEKGAPGVMFTWEES